MPVLVDERNLYIEVRADGLFHIKVTEAGPDDAIGGASRPSVDSIMDVIGHHMEQHAPVNSLIDLSGVPDLSLSERWRLAARMKGNRQWIRRTGMFGLSPAMTIAYRVIARVAGRDDLAFFDDEAAARQWLLDGLKREMTDVG